MCTYLLTSGIYHALPTGCCDGHVSLYRSSSIAVVLRSTTTVTVTTLAMSPDPSYAAFLKTCCPPPPPGAAGDLATTMPIDMAAPNWLDDMYYNQRLFFQKCLTTLACHLSVLFSITCSSTLKKHFNQTL
ncbi:hypothetical protein V6N12_072978 [Hibiscus sabdariffa]|uniref:Uncharacterized protein n=1 Tax=Hibiscus sabdariffa TaxID=183260 RepID=A0ABR2B6B0_9ROSI